MRHAARVVATAVAVLATGVAQARLVEPGDVLVAQVSPSAVVRIEPASGRTSVLAESPFAWDLAVDRDGDLVLASNAGVARLDLDDGALTTIRSSGFGGNVAGVAIGDDGTIWVGTSGSRSNVWSVDPATGAAALRFADVECLLSCTNADLGVLARDTDGALLLALRGYYQGDPGAIVRLDVATGASTRIARGDLLDDPWGVAVEADGSLLVADGGASALLRVARATGEQAVVSPLARLATPYRIALRGDGRVAATEVGSRVVLVDPLTEIEQVIGSVSQVRGLAAVPGVPSAPACANGLDDDGDRKRDWPHDPGCSSAADGTETPPCADGIDNDGDGLVDHPADPGCESAGPLAQEQPQCDDGRDDDGDGFFDHPDDPECLARHDNTEHWAPRFGGGEKPPRCGLGFELVAALAVWRARRKRAGTRAA